MARTFSLPGSFLVTIAFGALACSEEELGVCVDDTACSGPMYDTCPEGAVFHPVDPDLKPNAPRADVAAATGSAKTQCERKGFTWCTGGAYCKKDTR